MRGKLLVIGAAVVIGGTFGFLWPAPRDTHDVPSTTGRPPSAPATTVPPKYSRDEAIALVSLGLTRDPARCGTGRTFVWTARFAADDRTWSVGGACVLYERFNDNHDATPLEWWETRWRVFEDGQVVPVTEGATNLMKPEPTPSSRRTRPIPVEIVPSPR